MALPQQVIDNLSNEASETPNAFSGLILFSVGLFIILLIIYFGIILGYDPYLNNQLSQTDAKTNDLIKSIPNDQQASLLNFYSGLSNVQVLLNNHIAFSPFFLWLENNTEANVYYSNVSVSPQQKVSLSVNAKTQADMEQQIAIFESSPQISNISVSNVTQSQQNSTGIIWQQSSIILTMATSTFFYKNTINGN